MCLCGHKALPCPTRGLKRTAVSASPTKTPKHYVKFQSSTLISPGLQLGGWRGANNVTYGSRTGAFEINGFAPEVEHIKLLKMQTGRFLNDRDLNEYRKVCVIGKITAKVLFPEEDPIGKYIKISGVYFQGGRHFSFWFKRR